MTQYRKRPVVIEAIRWTGHNADEMRRFAGAKFDTIDPQDRGDDPANDAQVLDDLHSVWVPFATGDWVIRGVKGELYPCKNLVFIETYEEVA